MIERKHQGSGARAFRPASVAAVGPVAAAAVVSAALAGCCFGGNPILPPPPVDPPVGGGGGGGVGTAPVVGGSAVTLAPGFAPDPTTTTGNAGGPVQASTMGASCRGTISTAPNVVLTTTAAFPNLRILVNAPQDTTLVVRLANGQVLCDDDGGGYPNPAVSGSFPPGEHQVYVGTYSPTATGVGYTLGFTTNPAITPVMLGVGAPPSAPPPVAGAIPTQCGLAVASFGPLSIGSSVVPGVHSPYVGPDGMGGTVSVGSENSLNWVPDMQPFVGRRTTITSLEGLDGAGCPVVKIASDNGQFYWRIRDMQL
ncbi:MAG: hypothetical protein OHK0013_23930 [Sandaracinaceae bacterium]